MSDPKDFTHFGLDPLLLAAISEMGYVTPTPIQAKAIPVVLRGGDVMGAAQTGTGKTAGFGLPMLQRLMAYANASMSPARHPVRGLILEPTRELADQTADNMKKYAAKSPLRVAVVYGGVDMKPQTAALRRGCEGEFASGDHVLQAASVYGNFSSRLATQVGADGFLDIIDVAPVQVAHCRRKLAGCANVRVRVADAAVPDRVGYDAACSFFLLHEVPDVQKRQIVNALLAAVRPGGKVVFVDYHRPVRWHPLRPVMAAVFRWVEPYASGLVSRSIMDFADRAQDFDWRKETRFGGLYQVVVAQGRRRESAAGAGPAQSGIVRATCEAGE